MRNFGFKKTICSIVTFVFGTTQVLLYAPVASADTFTDYANQGSQQGADSRSWFLNNLPSLNGKKMTIKTQKGEDLSIESTDNMAGGGSDKYGYETTFESLDSIRDIAGDRDKQTDSAVARKNALMTAIQKITQGDSEAQTTIENTVYGIIDNLANTKMADYSSDAMWQMTRSVLENLALHAEDLATCDSETSLVTHDEVFHSPDIIQCTQVLDRTGECDLTHDYVVKAPISLADGASANIKSCGKNCIQTWLGQVGDNYLSGGSCSLFEFDIKYIVNSPEAISKVVLDYAKFDDQVQLYIGPENLEELVYSAPLNTFPFDDDGSRNSNRCELSTSWVWDPTGLAQRDSQYQKGTAVNKYPQPVDITRHFKQRQKGDIVRLRMRDAIGGKGEAFIRMVIYYDMSKVVAESDDWGPTSCMDTVVGISDGMADGSFTCTDMPELDENGCYSEGLAIVCEENVNPSPFVDISPLCRKVKVSGNFTFYKGDTGCWQGYMGSDADGNPIYEEVCGGENVGGNLDTCSEYEEAGCMFLGSECTDGMTGASGNCYAADLTYDCGKDVVVSKSTTETDFTCSGIRCLGTECAEINETKSTDFAKVNAVLNMLDNASQDMECTGVDDDGYVTGLSDVNCQVFKGESGKCKVALGGWQNCCKQNSSTPSVHTYIKTMRNVSHTKAAAEGINTMMQSGFSNFSSNLSEGLAGGIGNAAYGMMWQFAGQYVSFINKDVGNIIQVAAATPDFVYDGIGWLMDKAFSGATENITNLFNTAQSWVKELFNPIKSFFNEIKKKVSEYLQKLLTKFISKLTGNTTGAAVSGTAGKAGQDAAKKAGEKAVEKVVENSATEATGTAAANSGIMSAIGTAVMVVGYIYMAYMIAQMIVQIAFACEEEEMETVSQIAVKNCHYVGSYCSKKGLGFCVVKQKSYCCFQSQLGRIINEQIRLQKEEKTLEDGTVVLVPKIQDWGSAKDPYCEGLSVEDLNKVDWDAIDLSEWTRLLEENNLNMDQQKGLTEENMTGKAEAYR